MCTVTIISLREVGKAGFRLATNRDEARTRPAALPPRWHDLSGGLRAIYPVDPAGGGTWIAANEGGLVLCLLNANPLPPPELLSRAWLRSRGLLIPDLIGAGGRREVMAALERQELARYAPFRLVAVEPLGGKEEAGFAALEARWDLQSLTVQEPGPGPVCLVSSGLGDPLVTPRLPLFDEIVSRAGREMREAQDRFHRHTWPDRREISVLMSRSDARTVSITTVEIERRGAGLAGITMQYEVVPESDPTIVRTRVRPPTLPVT